MKKGESLAKPHRIPDLPLWPAVVLAAVAVAFALEASGFWVWLARAL